MEKILPWEMKRRTENLKGQRNLPEGVGLTMSNRELESVLNQQEILLLARLFFHWKISLFNLPKNSLLFPSRERLRDCSSSSFSGSQGSRKVTVGKGFIRWRRRFKFRILRSDTSFRRAVSVSIQCIGLEPGEMNCSIFWETSKTYFKTVL